MTVQTSQISTAFIWRRVHSLMGFWLVLYLIVHLVTNSQASLWIGDDGSGFVRLVNSLETLPYLQVVETFLIGIPLAIHGIWGIKRALSARLNASKSDGSKPAMGYSRNKAFTWQRASSWILLFGIIGHVAQMRYIDAPKKATSSQGDQYFVKLNFDEGLYTLAARLHVSLFNSKDLEAITKQVRSLGIVRLEKKSLSQAIRSVPYNPDEEGARDMFQKAIQEKQWMEAIASYKLNETQVVAAAPSPGVAMLLMVRDTFKSPTMAILYTIFVLAAAFHAFNGFWTFLIAWGMILSYRSQRAMLPVSAVGMLILTFLGLAAIWGSYLINLRY